MFTIEELYMEIIGKGKVTDTLEREIFHGTIKTRTVIVRYNGKIFSIVFRNNVLYSITAYTNYEK